MSTQPEKPMLADQLASLRLQRDTPPRASHNGVTVIVAVAVAAFLAGAGWLVATRLSAKVVETAPIVLVQPGQQAPLFVATGTVTAPVTATLAPRTSGRLARVMVQEGDEVKAQQPVAELDLTDFKLQWAQAKADVVVAEAKVADATVRLHSADVRLGRARKLAQSGAGTESAVEDAQLDLDAAKSQLQVAEGDLGVSRARLSTAQQNLADATLRAPFHGVVLRVLAQPGDFVPAALSSGVVRLANLSDLEVDAEVAEVNLAKVGEKMPVEVRLDAQPDRGLVGQVFAVRPNVDTAKATAVAKVRLDDVDTLALFPGMNGRVSFLAVKPDGAALRQAARLEIPAAALIHNADHDEVWVVDKEGVVQAVRVTPAGTDAERIIIKDGPAAGTLVVVAPANVKPGDSVHLNN